MVLKLFETLKSIEKQIIEYQFRLNKIEYELRENATPDEVYFLDHEKIEIEKAQKILELKRRHKIERKDGILLRVFWSIIAPIVVSVLISLLIPILQKYYH